MLDDALPQSTVETPSPSLEGFSRSEEEQVNVYIHQLQKSMWVHAGLLRDEHSLNVGFAAQTECELGVARCLRSGRHGRRVNEARSLACVAGAILRSALARTESRGAHFRTDYPRRDDANFKQHSIFTSENGASFEAW